MTTPSKSRVESEVPSELAPASGRPRPAFRDGYRSFDYLTAGADYHRYELVDQAGRAPPLLIELSAEDERRTTALVNRSPVISLHDHVGLFPASIGDTPDYVRQGRMATAFRGLAASNLDAVFDNLMNGICRIHSHSGWQWSDVIHDLGMRLCDLAHQDFVVPAHGVRDILQAKDDGKVAWIAGLEGAAMIENELDRIEILYGFGVRLLGITYSESNALGSGLKERRDGGLTEFGRKAVTRMNRVGMLIDCSHTGDQTALDTMAASEVPVVLSHIGARALWDSRRLAPDEVLEACAEGGGVIGVEAAPHTTISRSNPRHGLDSYMEHFEYIVRLVGIDHVAFGPDTVYGDHVELHRVYAERLSLEESRGASAPSEDGREYPQVEHVEGLENPTEASHNVVRWLVRNGYSDADIEKVLGGNILRVLRQVWA
ncbi:MAG TPA: membrane dipeptidase [Longimicrobiales bacterium]|nr:membrane dipeptidase [Longimicrobiales bacterium]